jgi:hypothetical protein
MLGNLLSRAHQVQMKGYEWHFTGEKLVTIWSAPNYMYSIINLGAVLKKKIGEKCRNAKKYVPEGRIAQYFV